MRACSTVHVRKHVTVWVCWLKINSYECGRDRLSARGGEVEEGVNDDGTCKLTHRHRVTASVPVRTEPVSNGSRFDSVRCSVRTYFLSNISLKIHCLVRE